MANPKILISAGEASGDLYASSLVEALRARLPEMEFFGCAGPRMRAAGVRQIVDAASLSVVGLVEVVRDLPRIHSQFRLLVGAVERERPDVAVLTDSPSFHLRLAAKLRPMGIPIIYLVAPQIWAWKKWRIRHVRKNVDRLLCIFPFEEEYFRQYGIEAEYIGHPLARLIRPRYTREEFMGKHRIPKDRPVVTLLPGSRAGEAGRHLPALADAVVRLNRQRAATFVLATPDGTVESRGSRFWEPISRAPIQVIEGETWDAIAHADVALAASGTVTVEAALLGTPMVTFYKVSPLTWWLGRILVKVPFYSMVNLLAGRRIVPEFMQGEATGEGLAGAALELIANPDAHAEMKRNLQEVAAKLSVDGNPMERAADLVQGFLG